MIKPLSFFLLLLIFACQGKLSDEQRKEMKKQMELHKIKRVTDAEITAAAFERGRAVMAMIISLKGDSSKIDSLIQAYGNNVRWVQPGKGNARELEQQLIDAYIASEAGGAQDNVQKVRNAEGDYDSLLYTKPIVTQLPDGIDRLEGVWNIWMSRKELILGMDKK